MSAFSNIPPQAVLPLGAYDRGELERAAARADQTLLQSDCQGARDKNSVLARIGEDLRLPAYYGRNLDALYDCLTDLQPESHAERPGFVVILENLPDGSGFDSAERARLLDVFRDAADFFYEQKTAFRVFYSVRKT